MNKASVDAGRVSLPAEMVKPFGEPTSREDIPVWLFLIDPGHLRLMADEQVQEMLGDGSSRIDALSLVTREEENASLGCV